MTGRPGDRTQPLRAGHDADNAGRIVQVNDERGERVLAHQEAAHLLGCTRSGLLGPLGERRWSQVVRCMPVGRGRLLQKVRPNQSADFHCENSSTVARRSRIFTLDQTSSIGAIHEYLITQAG